MVSAVRDAALAIDKTGENHGPREAMVFCPQCKALQTIWINGGALMPTRKFTQIGRKIYHDCAPNQPCRLFLGW